MSPAKDTIDMNKLSQRELIILIHDKVERLNDNVKCLTQKSIDQKLDIERIKTRNNVISAGWGIAAVIISAIIKRF